MDSWVKHQKKSREKNKQEEQQQKMDKFVRRNRQFQKTSKQRMINKLNEWVNDNNDILKTLNDGCDSHVHHTLFDHRPTVSSSLHKSGIYLKTYQPEKERTKEQEKINKANILDRNEYEDIHGEQGFRINYLRKRERNRERGPMRYGNRTENERLKQKMEQNSLIDQSMADCSMVHYPDWKPNQKQKWLNKDKDYRLVSNSNTAWDVVKVRNSKEGYEYREGSVRLGEQLIARKREKKKEHDRSEFIAVVQKDVWNTIINNSTSNRTMHMD